MLKAVFLLPRRKDLTRKEFFDYWRTIHLPLVEKLPGVRRCVVSEVIAAPEGDMPCEAVVELWWDDVEAVRVAIDSAEAKACEESLVHFVDMPRWQVFLAREFDGPTASAGHEDGPR